MCMLKYVKVYVCMHACMGRGDLYVTLHVVTPRDLAREERRLLEELAQLRGETTSRKDPARGTLRRPEF